MTRPHHPAAPGAPTAALAVLLSLLAFQLSCGAKKTTAPPPPPTDPVCAVTPTSINFGTTPLGASTPRTFQIANTGGGTLTGMVSVSCPQFALGGPGSYSLTAGQSTIFNVRFTPTRAGRDTCRVSTGCAEVICVANGQGPSFEVYPDTLRFYRNRPNERIAFIIHNTGSTTLSGTVHSPSPEFRVLFDSTYALAPGADKLFQVSFVPAGPGLRTCVLNTGLSGGQVYCSGIGPRLTVTPATLDLGDSWDRIDKAFVLTNVDSFPLSGTITVPCGPFSLAGSATYNLAPGESVTDTVRYSPPNADGTQDCQFDLEISTAGPACHGQSQYLEPTSTNRCAAPTSYLLDFGTVVVGGSATRTLTVQNPSSSALTCDGVLLEYSNELSLSSGTYSLRPGESQGFDVTVTPQTVGLHHILIQFWSWDTDIAHQVGAYVECRVRAVAP
jgi:hypothetical protein